MRDEVGTEKRTVWIYESYSWLLKEKNYFHHSRSSDVVQSYRKEAFPAPF